MTSCGFKYEPGLESGWASEPNPIIKTMQWGRGREDEGVEGTFSPCYLQHSSTGKRHKVLNVTQVCHFNHSYLLFNYDYKKSYVVCRFISWTPEKWKKNL